MNKVDLQHLNSGSEVEKINMAIVAAYDDFKATGKDPYEKRVVSYKIELQEDRDGRLNITGKLDIKLARQYPTDQFTMKGEATKINGQLSFEFERGKASVEVGNYA